MAKLFTKLKGFFQKNLVTWYGTFMVRYFKQRHSQKKCLKWNICWQKNCKSSTKHGNNIPKNNFFHFIFYSGIIFVSISFSVTLVRYLILWFLFEFLCMNSFQIKNFSLDFFLIFLHTGMKFEVINCF